VEEMCPLGWEVLKEVLRVVPIVQGGRLTLMRRWLLCKMPDLSLRALIPAMMFPGSVSARNVDVKLFLDITTLRVVAVAASIVLGTL
jgi:hypothetical protein